MSKTSIGILNSEYHFLVFVLLFNLLNFFFHNFLCSSFLDLFRFYSFASLYCTVLILNGNK